MGSIKRFCLIVFGLAGVLCLCVLALPWIGPFQHQAASLMNNGFYYMFMQVVLAITLLGLLITLLRGFLTPRTSKTVVIAKDGGDQLTVSTAAISSQATHVVEEQGNLVAEKVHVQAKRSGVDVDVRVRPRRTVDVSREGKRLHESLSEGLATICGDRVKHINIEFVEAEQPMPALDVRVENLEIPASVYERAALAQGAEAPTEKLAADATTPLGEGSSDATETVDAETATQESEVGWR